MITIRDDLYDTYRGSMDFIRRYIFPGGHLPSAAALNEAIRSTGPLVLNRQDSIGAHYDRTLREWRRRFGAAAGELHALGLGESFQRTWQYYFAYCEAGFRSGMLDDLHLVIDSVRPQISRSGRSAA